MNQIDNRVEVTLEEIRKQYRELKRGDNIDPFALGEKIKSFIDFLKSKDESYLDLIEEAEDTLIDVTFMAKENCCNPLKAKSIK
jgi:hypothetical protein